MATRPKEKEGTFKLPSGGYLMASKVGSLLGIPVSSNLLFLNRRKIQIIYPKGLSLAAVKKFVDRAVKEKRAA